MSTKFEYFQDVILHQLINNSEFLQHAGPFIKQEYFEDPIKGKIFKAVNDHVETHHAAPNEPALKICIQSLNISDSEYTSAIGSTEVLYSRLDKPFAPDWLITNAENWCKKRAFFNVMTDGAALIGKKVEDFTNTDVPTRMEEALAISFDSNIGMDYKEDWKRRYDYSHSTSERFEFDLEILNKITKGGLPRKTLSVLMSTDTGGFKSGSMCHFSAAWIAKGYNVLYISMEMSEEVVGQRIDANLMNTNLDDLADIPFKTYEAMSKTIRDNTPGNLIIKEYPTSSAHAGHFRHLINELKQKKGFIPDIICVDYLNICASSRLGNNISNSYTYVKSIAEEIRALAFEFNVAIISATQGNRGASGASDISIANVSESIGLPATVDVLIGIIFTEEMDEENYIQFKQLKNRLGDVNYYRKWNMGIDKAKMKLMDMKNQPTTSGGLSAPLDTTSVIALDNPSSKKAFDDFIL